MTPKTLKIGIDIDGVLADWNTQFIRTLEDVSGKKSTLAPGAEPPCWDYFETIGFSKQDAQKAWDTVRVDPGWWIKLRPYLEAPPVCKTLYQMYQAGHEVFFITNRSVGLHVHQQTVSWLIMNGYLVPQVLRTARKELMAEALQLDFYLDDMPENCFTVKHSWPLCQTFLLKRAYNETYAAEAADKHVTVIGTLRAFFEAMDLELNAHALIV